jgi:hypothetical protein
MQEILPAQAQEGNKKARRKNPAGKSGYELV